MFAALQQVSFLFTARIARQNIVKALNLRSFSERLAKNSDKRSIELASGVQCNNQASGSSSHGPGRQDWGTYTTRRYPSQRKAMFVRCCCFAGCADATAVIRLVQLGIGGQLLDLVVEPLTCFGCTRLIRSRADAVHGGTILVKSRARASIRQCLSATIRLTWSLQPEVGINDSWPRSFRSGDKTDPSTSDVAPVSAVRTHACNTIATSVNDHVGLKATDAF